MHRKAQKCEIKNAQFKTGKGQKLNNFLLNLKKQMKQN